MPPEQTQNQSPQTPAPNEKVVINNVAPIHTYKSDVANFIKEGGKSMADIAIAENARHSKYMEAEKAEPVLAKRAVTIAVVVLILITLSAGILWISSLGKSGEQLQTLSTPSMFISGIDSKTISIDKLNQSEALNAISNILNQSSPFLAVNPTEKNSNGTNVAITVQTFFSKLGIYPPADLLRALTGQFSIGSIGGQARFLVLKTNYYAGAFAGMLGWEKKPMEKDLQGLLNLPKPNNSGIKTETDGTSTVLISVSQSAFTDSIISNRDARILKDGAGSTILIYLFPDNNTIIITSNENTAKIVTDKLLKSASN